MINNKHMKIVVASAGRRAHYIPWFREALQSQKIPGEVIAMDYRATSPTVGLADRAVQTPAYNSSEYLTMMRQWFEAERPDLFLCMNDYEMQILSNGLAATLRDTGCTVAVLDSAAQDWVLDKYLMAKTLEEHAIPTPQTRLGSEVSDVVTACPSDMIFVVKHRFGSGSTGLHIVQTPDLEKAVADSAQTALGQDGHKAPDGPAAVLIQEHLPGHEFGVDGVFSLDGQGELLGVLARRTEQMRAGDPDVATTVSGERFVPIMRQLGRLLRPIGPINADFRENAAGEPQIIDINPRMGGGYPYNHRAGADMPAALVRAVAGLEHLPELLEYELGVTTARHEEFTVISREAADTVTSISRP